MTAAIDRAFAELLMRTFNDPDDLPVHLLFNQFWQHAPAEVVAAYATQFTNDHDLAAFVDAGYYAEPFTLERLASCPSGSYGRAVHGFIVDNGLEANLATNYRHFHQTLEDAGMLDGMPDPMRYAVLRGFQLHDLIHVVTGYGPSPLDEIALQAFCLAQLQFPYFAMWISVVTTRMTFIEPDSIVGIMDAITQGWQFGRQVDNLQLHRWEDHLDEPLADLRRTHRIDPAGRGIFPPISPRARPVPR
jgi:ubiquinone biosynthesis protein COQ4